MRHVLTLVTMAALWSGLVSFGMADDQKIGNPPKPGKVETRAETATTASLQAEFHRTLADLIEARSAEKPDQAKIGELTQKLQQLRGKRQATAPAAAANAPAGWGCPWGGPGMGWGRGGCGAGFGPGAGRGWGGAGAGRGLGPGAGQGLAPGGPAFVDHDSDGVCDYYESRHGMHR